MQLIIRLPVTFALIISTALTMLYCKIPLMTMVQQMSKAVNSFSLLAIPFFILMGEIMGAGGISSRLLEFANVCVGHLRGGLAHVNILASMFFGGISGSAVADVSSLGTLEIPMMEKAGYDRPFATAVTVSSACQGLIDRLDDVSVHGHRLGKEPAHRSGVVLFIFSQADTKALRRN